MALLQGFEYVFKGNFPSKFIAGFFKLLLFGVPLLGYQVRISQQVSRGNEHELPEGNLSSEIGLGLALLFLYLPLIYVNSLLTKGTASLTDVVLGGSSGVVETDIIPMLLATVIFAIPSFVIYLRWMQTDNFAKAFSPQPAIELIREYPMELAAGYVQYIAPVLGWVFLYAALFGSVLALSPLVCVVLFLFPLPAFLQGYVVGKVAYNLRMMAIDKASGEVEGPMEDEF